MTQYRPLTRLEVGLVFGGDTTQQHVGDMLRTSDGSIYFQYSAEFLATYLPLSPIALKQQPTAQGPGPQIFSGLYGVFADSLPDGWGLLLMSRTLRKAGIDYSSISPLDRLAFVGRSGMGALIYHPSYADSAFTHIEGHVDLLQVARDSRDIIAGAGTDLFPLLAQLGGTAGGARPKVLVGIGTDDKLGLVMAGADELPSGYEHWIVKFRGKDERPDAGIVEWAYAQTAARIGLTMSATRLFSGGDAPWFGTKRFDRLDGGRRLHLHTLAGLLHADFRAPSVDYEILLQAVLKLTRRQDDLESAYRLAVFNVTFHNRDDHAKNFSFVLDQNGSWRFAPAYDLTFNRGPGGEHSTAVAGEGKNPGLDDLLRLAVTVGIRDSQARKIIEEVESGRNILLDLLKQHGVKKHPVQEVLSRAKRHR